jgi:hypothetical protein
MSTWARAGAILFLDQVRRLLREGLVVRSLVSPIALVLGTVVATVAVVVWLRPPVLLAVTPAAADPALVEAVAREGFAVVEVDDPGEAVDRGDAAIGTDGTRLWVATPPAGLEQAVRLHLGARWSPDFPIQRRQALSASDDAPRSVVVLLGVVFAMYGVIVGAGGIARDRDLGTLDADLSTPVPHVLQGFVRWAAGTAVLGTFFAFAVTAVDGVMGLAHPGTAVAHGYAATGAATAFGIVAVGRSGLDKGFAAPLSLGLVLVTGFTALGVGGADAAAPWLPIASLVSRGAPVLPPVALSAALGLLAALVFARRTAVQ